MASSSTSSEVFQSVTTGQHDLTLFQQLPVLAIVVPLLFAALITIVHKRNFALIITQTVSFAVFIASLLLFFELQQKPEIIYYLGGWKSPYGISLHLDLLNGFVGLLVGLIATVSSTFLPQLLQKEIPYSKFPLFCTAFLLCLAGLMGITYTGDAFNIFVFLEITSLSSYALIAMGRDRRALTASYQYLIMGTIGATFILIGIGFLYAMTGSLNIADIHLRLADKLDSNTVKTAFAFITVGIALKAAVFPLHLWLNNAYSFAPSVVSAFIAATSTKVSVYLFFRFFFTLFGYEQSFGNIELGWILIPLSILGIFFGTYKALYVTDVKSLLASSSVAQVGYMTLGIGLATQTSLAGSVVHLFNHGLMKGLLFLSIAGFLIHAKGSLLTQLSGLGKIYPLLGVGMTVGGLSLIGVPLTAGFTGKLLLLQATINQGHYLIVAFILLASVGALFYVWRFLQMIWFGEINEADQQAQQEWLRQDAFSWSGSPLNAFALISLIALIIANIAFGIFTTETVFIADQIAKALIGAPL